MEDLNKHQIVLLTLLVSFVTSIATGIVTVSLMEQAPTNVVQRINRVVERTVETVVPAENQSAAVVTKETTVVVKEDDLITNTIADGAEYVVRIYRQVVLEDGTVADRLVNLGVVFKAEGVIVTENSKVPSGGTYTAVFENGSKTPLIYVGADVEAELAFLKIDAEKLGETVLPSFTRPTSANLEALKLGQSVVALGGAGRSVASVGIVSSLHTDSITVPATATTATTTKNQVSLVQLNVVPSSDMYGGPAFTIFGELIGVHTRTQEGNGLFTPLQQVIQSYNALQSTAQLTATSTPSTTQ